MVVNGLAGKVLGVGIYRRRRWWCFPPESVNEFTSWMSEFPNGEHIHMYIVPLTLFQTNGVWIGSRIVSHYEQLMLFECAERTAWNTIKCVLMFAFYYLFVENSTIQQKKRPFNIYIYICNLCIAVTIRREKSGAKLTNDLIYYGE